MSKRVKIDWKTVMRGKYSKIPEDKIQESKQRIKKEMIQWKLKTGY
jgi:hypothetical protein